MADQAYRAAERRARESGEVADAARLLLERVRRGELQPGALSLAAYLGDSAAGAALGVQVAVDERDELARDRWTRGLLAWGRPVFGRGLFAAVMAELEGTPVQDRTGQAALIAALQSFWSEPTELRSRELHPNEARRSALGLGLTEFELMGILHKAFSVARLWVSPRQLSRTLPPLHGVRATPGVLRPRMVPWALTTRDALTGPTGTDLVHEAVGVGTPRERMLLADRFRAALGREVRVKRQSGIVHRLVPRSIDDEYVRGDIPEQPSRSFRLTSIVELVDPGAS